MKKYHLILIILGFALLVNTGCKKDEHNHVDHDAIYKLTLEMTSLTDTVLLSFNDADGDGGISPIISGGNLKINTLYSGVVKVYSKQDNQFVDITDEIVSEGDKHQFFYSSTIAGLSFNYTDKDTLNQPIGITTNIKTEGSGSGTLNLVLKHEPNKSAQGVSSGNIANAGGETDADIVFPLSVQ